MKTFVTAFALSTMLASAAYAAPIVPPGSNGGGAGIALPVIAAMIFLDDQYKGEVKCQAQSKALHYVATPGHANCVTLSQMPWAPADVRPWSVRTVFPNY